MTPFRAFEAQEIVRVRDRLSALIEQPGLDPRSSMQSRHLDLPLVRELCLAAPIVGRVRAVLGDSIVLWRSNFFPKRPGEGAFDWHRDRDHWTTMLDPMVNVTAWLALERTTRENGCLEFRSGYAELEAGECVLFDQDTLHRSGPNRSGEGRLALAIRFTRPGVRIDRSRLFPAYETLPVP